MIINNNVSAVLRSYTGATSLKNKEDKAAGAGRSDRQDEIILSAQAQSFGQILQKVKANSPVRQDRVEELSQKIDSGTYNVDARIIAEKMLSSRY